VGRAQLGRRQAARCRVRHGRAGAVQGPGPTARRNGFAHVEYPDEFYVTFEHSWICPKRDENRFFGIYERISGPTGAICLDEGKVFWRDDKKDPVQLKEPGGEPRMTEDSMAAFFKSMRTGTPPVSGVVNGRAATLTGLLVRKAVYEHRRVLMSEIV